MPLTETTTDPGSMDRPPLSRDERANRFDVLSRLADDLAHEIKNPLNAMVVNLELMRRWVENGKTDAAIERAAVIEHEIRRVHLLAEQLLQLLRPGRGAQGPEAVDAIIDSLSAAVQVQAKAARVEFVVQAESSLYAHVDADRFRFALLELLTAAIDAEAESGGAVTLFARRVGAEIYVEVNCSRARLEGESTLVLPQARFGTNETTGSQL